MPRGRPRKPVERHLLEGTYRADRHGPVSGDIEPATAPPPMPAKLFPAEAAVWAEVVGLLTGVVKPRDVPTLVELCRWLVRADRIAAALADLKPGAKGYASLLVSSAISSDKIAALSARFGLSPSDRARLGAVASGPPAATVRTRPKTKLDDAPPPTA